MGFEASYTNQLYSGEDHRVGSWIEEVLLYVGMQTQCQGVSFMSKEFALSPLL